MIKDENGCYTGSLKGNDKHGVGVMMFETGEEYFVPGFQSGPMPYYFEAMPVGLDLDEVVADW